MNYTKLAFKFMDWWNSPNCPEDLEKADVDVCVLAWADATETDLGDGLNELCNRIIELGIL